MNAFGGLLAEQSAYFRGLDPQLPDEREPPHGEVLTANTSSGRRVACVLTSTVHGPGKLPSLWSAREVRQLHPLVGDTGGEGVAALLARLPSWQHRLARRRAYPDDSSWTVVWPSRDITATRAFLDHGFVPLSVLAVRTREGADARGETVDGPARIRRAEPTDLDAVLALAMAELEYSAQVGGAVVRDDAEDMKRKALGYHLTVGSDPVWLADCENSAVGLAECRMIDVGSPGPGERYPVRPGTWGYVNCLAVLRAARGRGIGHALMSVAHREFARSGALGSYLYFNPANPLSSVFWPRHGYRPLWTVWEVRPAHALR